MEKEEWRPCPKCGKTIDGYGWSFPGKDDMALEPHVCEYLADIKATGCNQHPFCVHPFWYWNISMSNLDFWD